MNFHHIFFLFIYFLASKCVKVESSCLKDIAYKKILTEATNFVLNDFIRISQAEDVKLTSLLSFSVLYEAMKANQTFLSNCGYDLDDDTLSLMILDYFVKKCITYNIGFGSGSEDTKRDLDQDAKSVIILLYDFHVLDIEIHPKYLIILIEFLFRFGGHSLLLNNVFYDLTRMITASQAEDVLKMISKKFDPTTHSLFNMIQYFSKVSANSTDKSFKLLIETIDSLHQRLSEYLTELSDNPILYEEHLTNIFIFVLISNQANRFDYIISQALKSIDFSRFLNQSTYIYVISIAVVADTGFFDSLPNLIINDQIFLNLKSENGPMLGRLFESLESTYPDRVCECKAALSELNRTKFSNLVSDFFQFQSIQAFAVNLASVATYFESDDPKTLIEFIKELECTNKNFKTISDYEYSLSIDIFNAITDFIDSLPDYKKCVSSNLAALKFRLIVLAHDIVMCNAAMSSNSHLRVMKIINFYLAKIAPSLNRNSESISINLNTILDHIDSLIVSKCFTDNMHDISLIYKFLALTSTIPDSHFNDIVSKHLRCNESFILTKNLIDLSQEKGTFQPEIFLSYFLDELDKYFSIPKTERIELNRYKNGLIIKLASHYHKFQIFDKSATYLCIKIIKNF